jgi:hypothetical protein
MGRGVETDQLASRHDGGRINLELLAEESRPYAGGSSKVLRRIFDMLGAIDRPQREYDTHATTLGRACKQGPVASASLGPP